MKVFQIWNKPELPCEPYRGYMENIRRMSDVYLLISPGDGFEELYESLPEALKAKHNGAFNLFDAMRIKFLSEHFDFVYLDLDIELFMPIQLSHLPMLAGPGVLVGNGDAELGKQVWNNYSRLSPHFCRVSTLGFSGVKTLPVPPEMFKHHYARGNYSG